MAEKHPFSENPGFPCIPMPKRDSAYGLHGPHPNIPPPSQALALTRNTGSKLVGELREKIIIGTVLGGPEDNDGASIVH